MVEPLNSDYKIPVRPANSKLASQFGFTGRFGATLSHYLDGTKNMMCVYTNHSLVGICSGAKEKEIYPDIPRHVDTFKEENEIDLMAVQAERLELKKQLAGLETEMEGYLKELGYAS